MKNTGTHLSDVYNIPLNPFSRDCGEDRQFSEQFKPNLEQSRNIDAGSRKRQQDSFMFLIWTETATTVSVKLVFLKRTDHLYPVYVLHYIFIVVFKRLLLSSPVGKLPISKSERCLVEGHLICIKTENVFNTGENRFHGHIHHQMIHSEVSVFYVNTNESLFKKGISYENVQAMRHCIYYVVITYYSVSCILDRCRLRCFEVGSRFRKIAWKSSQHQYCVCSTYIRVAQSSASVEMLAGSGG